MMMNVKQTDLPNGVRVVTSTMSHVQSVAVGIWVGVGGRHEPAPEAGVSHFIEHLLFKGTAKRSARQISEAIEGKGGYLNAFTQEEMTCYYARVASDHVWTALDVLADMYLHPRLAPADIEKERGVIIEEMMMYRDQPDQVVQEMLGETLWPGHALGRPLIGNLRSIKSLQMASIQAYKQRTYVPENTVFAFAGRVEPADCVKQVRHLMSGLKANPAPPYDKVTDQVKQERLALKAKAIEQTHMAMGFRVFGRFDPRRFPLKVLNVILGENMSSRLFQVVREKYGLAYSIHSTIQLFEETGVFVISAGLDRERREKAVRLVCREVARLKKEAVPADELKRAKEYVVGHLKLALENTSGHMMWIGENLMSYNAFVSPESVVKAVDAVTVADVRRLANELFQPDLTSLAILSPGLNKKDEAACRQCLHTL